MRQSRNHRQRHTRNHLAQREPLQQSWQETQNPWEVQQAMTAAQRFQTADEASGFWIRGRKISYMSICGAALFVSLLVLLLACFSAMTYYSASQKLAQAETSKTHSQEYYAAESTASEIIEAFYQERRDTSANLNGRTVYAADQGDIEVTKIDNVIYFSVPAGDGRLLNVEARASKKQVTVQKWQLGDES